MNRKRVDYERNYRHRCPAKNFTETQISEEICPKCGIRGAFNGWKQGMYYRMAKKSSVLGFPCTGVHMTFLPEMTRSCKKCKGEGILQGEKFDYECPECNELGSFIFRTEDEMRKIRRWALIRHQKLVRDKKAKLLQQDSIQKKIPDNPVFTRDPKVYVSKMMGLFDYHKKFSVRNYQIGEIMLNCDDHGWDVFMPILEMWENSYRGISPDNNCIKLKRSLRKNASTLISLHPKQDELPQRMFWNRKLIRKQIGQEKETYLWNRFPQNNIIENSCIQIDEEIKKEEFEELIKDLLDCID